MTIAACTPAFTLPAASKAAGLFSILSHVKIDGEYVTLTIPAGGRVTLDTVYANAARLGLEVVNKPKRPGVAAIWKGDTLYGVWHKNDKTVKIYEDGCRPYGN